MEKAADISPATAPALLLARACRPGRTLAALVVCDLAALTLATGLAVAVRGLWPGAMDATLYLKLWPALPLFLLSYKVAGLYPGIWLVPGIAVGPVEELRRACIATSLVMLALAASSFITRGAVEYSRAVFLLAWPLAMVAVPLARSLLRATCASRAWWGQPCLVLGAGKTGEMVIAALQRQPGLGLKPVAVLDDAPAGRTELAGVPLLEGLHLAAPLAAEARAAHAIVAMPGQPRDVLLAIAARLEGRIPHLLIIPDLFGFGSLWVSARNLGGVLGLEVREELLLPGVLRLKRAADLSLAVAVGLAALPLSLLVALAIRLDSRGPVIFRQERLGQDGRPFRALKFRTMHVDAEARLGEVLAADADRRDEYATYHKLRRDPRVTRIGRLLRHLSLDELPQLWNVLRGDMSLVGPRAYIPAEQPHMHDADAIILRVPPGITGLWQVSGRNEIPFAGRLQMDIYYVRNWSLWLDLYILARTPLAIIRRDGAY